MQQADLTLLWSFLYDHPLNLGQYIVHFLDRQSKKTTGGISCGGVITSLAKHCGVDLEGYVVAPGSMIIDYATLKMSKFINVDIRLQGYILQKKQDHFPFPDVQNTVMHGFAFRDNWRMNTKVHNKITRANPPQVWANVRKMPLTPYENPNPILPMDDQVNEEIPRQDEGADRRRRQRNAYADDSYTTLQQEPQLLRLQMNMGQELANSRHGVYTTRWEEQQNQWNFMCQQFNWQYQPSNPPQDDEDDE